MTREVINELKKYTAGKKNTQKTEISVLVLNRLIFALEEQEAKWISVSEKLPENNRNYLMTKEELEMRTLIRESDVIDKTDGSELAKAFNYLWEKYVEQEPKTVIYSGDGYADGYMVYDMAECPNCDYEYEDGDKDWELPFCPSCSQKLNWESEEV